VYSPQNLSNTPGIAPPKKSIGLVKVDCVSDTAPLEHRGTELVCDGREPLLQARVVLRVDRLVVEVVLVVLAGIPPFGVGRGESDLGLAFEELIAQSHGHVEGDVAMHEPGAYSC
jgi:hypothetical protein